MQLYYAPGACSLASHISLQETGLPYDTVSVNLRDKKTAAGADYNAINSKGYVPALKLDSGEVLTEGAAILGYIGELAPAKKLIGAPGSLENFRVREWLVYIGTELHKNFGPLFNPAAPEAVRQAALATVKRRLAWASESLGKKPFLTGDQFTVADAYLFTVLSWSGHAKLDLAEWPNLVQFFERVKARPAVKTVMQAEGLPA